MTTITDEIVFGVWHDQTWADYETALAERDRLGRRYRITYDQGDLEIMSVSATHERMKELIVHLLVMFVTAKRVKMASLGGMTCRREDLERGLEPDSCFYFTHEAIIRGRYQIDLDRDPPPDLAVEIEVSRSVLNRIGIYEAIGVREIWRYDGEDFTILVRGDDGHYRESATSRELPTLPVDEFRRRLAFWDATDTTTWLCDWQDWVRANVPG